MSSSANQKDRICCFCRRGPTVTGMREKCSAPFGEIGKYTRAADQVADAGCRWSNASGSAFFGDCYLVTRNLYNMTRLVLGAVGSLVAFDYKGTASPSDDRKAL